MQQALYLIVALVWYGGRSDLSPDFQALRLCDHRFQRSGTRGLEESLQDSQIESFVLKREGEMAAESGRQSAAWHVDAIF